MKEISYISVFLLPPLFLFPVIVLNTFRAGSSNPGSAEHWDFLAGI